ncbi:MAG TPA: hypothetical protein VHF22_13320, partial [Planctomycetota bacterium]|nr:hypothetical protein [Planctomycetota bacterium]
MKLSTKLYAGFGGALALMVVVAHVGWRGVTAGEEAIRELDRTGDINSAQSEVAGEAKGIRVWALMFYDNGDDANVEGARKSLERLRAATARIEKNARPDEADLRRCVADLRDAADRYEAGFQSIVKPVQRDRELKGLLGATAERLTATIERGADLAGKGGEAEIAGRALAAALDFEESLDHVYAFFNTGEAPAAGKATEDVKRADAAIAAAAAATKVAPAQAELASAKKDLEAYAAALAEAVPNVAAIRHIRYEVAPELVKRIADANDRLVATITQLQGGAAATGMEATRRANLVATAVSLAAGIALVAIAFLLTRSVLAVIARTAEEISAGADQVAAAAGQVSAASQQL